MTNAYPLQWPAGWPRTAKPVRSRFDVTLAQARDELLDEIGRLGGAHVVISSNLPTRRDGLPYADRRAPADTGVAVYFVLEGRQRVFACDRWDDVGDNIRAIQRTLEALRGIDRWGASEMMARAFEAFVALPPAPSCWTDLGLERATATREMVAAAFRRLAKDAHPDHGGSAELMARLTAARDAAMDEIAGRAMA